MLVLWTTMGPEVGKRDWVVRRSRSNSGDGRRGIDRETRRDLKGLRHKGGGAGIGLGVAQWRYQAELCNMYCLPQGLQVSMYTIYIEGVQREA